jgi:hypothetical protein
MKLFPAPVQCNTEKRKVAKKREEFVNKVVLNIMDIDGLTIICKR